jgi:hypothetical protein
MRIAREPDGVLAGCHQFRERNPRLWRVHLVHAEVDVVEYFASRATGLDQHLEQRRKFGRLVDPLTQSNDRPLFCAVQNGTQSGRYLGLPDVAQLNLPLNTTRFEVS